jgi:GT2 family glycosyltransferase
MDLKKKNILKMIRNDIDISIVLVNYRTPKLTKECVESIIANSSELNVEIIVVDNNSEDESESLITGLFPKVKWINTGYNSGFARANNIGIKNAIGNYILLLNSDTIVNEKTLINTFNDYQNLEKSNHNVGFLGCQLIDLNGNIQHNSRPKIRNIEKIVISHPVIILFSKLLRIKPEDKAKSHFERDHLHTTFHETMWLGGTFLFYNRKLSSVEGEYLDEDFFMYGEDTEWSLRLTKKGYKHFFTPNASVIHAEGGSFKIKAPKWVQISVSEWLFIMKYYGKFKYFFIALFNLSGLRLDYFFLKRLIKSKGNEVDHQLIEDLALRKEVLFLMQKIFFKILFRYKRKTSASKEYLKII